MPVRWRVLRLVGSFAFGLAAGILLNVPRSFPLDSIFWKILVAAGAMQMAPTNFNIAALIGRKVTMRWSRFLLPLILDAAAVVLILLFLELPGRLPTFVGRIVFVGVVAGLIPGWPDAGMQLKALVKRNG